MRFLVDTSKTEYIKVCGSCPLFVDAEKIHAVFFRPHRSGRGGIPSEYFTISRERAMSDELPGHIIYIDEGTKEELFGDVKAYDPDELEPGMNIMAYVPGKGKQRYKIKDVQRAYNTRVYVKRVWMHYTDLLLLLVLAVVGKIVIQQYFDFLIPW